jgi:hypothetical protein
MAAMVTAAGALELRDVSAAAARLPLLPGENVANCSAAAHAAALLGDGQLEQGCHGAPAAGRLLTSLPLLLQVLEAVLPETPAEMLQLVLRHKRQGASGRFAACQLMAIAAECMVRPVLLLCSAGVPGMSCSGECTIPGC